MKTRIARFYAGEEPDHRGRLVADIQKWSPGKLEAHHDYIQWLFPLPEPSPVNPLAPVLDSAAIAEFQGSPPLRAALLASFERMLCFYGFELLPGSPCHVEQTSGFADASANWLTPGNHNHLRITRILRSTRLLGLEQESKAFFRALEALYGTDQGRRNIGGVSFRYWQSAVS